MAKKIKILKVRYNLKLIDLELSVLGSILIDNEALSDSIDILKKEYFYKTEHQYIYEAINLFQDSKPIDILTVTEELKRLGTHKNVGNISYISNLTTRISSSKANTEYHSRIIKLENLFKECQLIFQVTLLKKV